jgi:hypothetical protein
LRKVFDNKIYPEIIVKKENIKHEVFSIDGNYASTYPYKSTIRDRDIVHILCLQKCKLKTFWRWLGQKIDEINENDSFKDIMTNGNKK